MEETMPNSPRSETQDWLDLYLNTRQETILEMRKRIIETRQELNKRESERSVKISSLIDERNVAVSQATNELHVEYEKQKVELERVLHMTELTQQSSQQGMLGERKTRELIRSLFAIPSLIDMTEMAIARATKKLPVEFLSASKLNIATVYIIKCTPQFFSRVATGVREKLKHTSFDYELKAKNVTQRITPEYDLKIKELQQEINRGKAAFEQERQGILKSTAGILVNQLITAADEMRRCATTASEQEKMIYQVLDELRNGKKLSGDVLNGIDQESICKTIDVLVRDSLIDQSEGERVALFVSLAQERAGSGSQNEKPAPMTADAVATLDLPTRYRMMEGVIGNGDDAQRIIEANSGLTTFSPQKFTDYLSQLKKTLRAVRTSTRDITPASHPERFSSLESLVSLESEIMQAGASDEITRLNQELAQGGYDPEIVHAVIKAFKPNTKKFIGENYLPQYNIKRNLQSQLPPEKLGSYIVYLEKLKKQKVLIAHAKPSHPYSLNPRLADISNSALRNVLAMYLGKNNH